MENVNEDKSIILPSLMSKMKKKSNEKIKSHVKFNKKLSIIEEIN